MNQACAQTGSARAAAVPASCRVLAVLAIEGPMTVDDLAAYPELGDLTRLEIGLAVDELLAAHALDRWIRAVHYRDGDQCLRRDVTVFTARGGVA